jgi:hypothetical protein
MVLMYTSALETMRRPFFETFWYTHHLFVLFFAAVVIHGTPVHFRDSRFPLFEFDRIEAAVADRFVAGMQDLLGKATFWQWLIGPAVLYIIERTIRIIRGSQPVMLVQVLAGRLRTFLRDIFRSPGDAGDSASVASDRAASAQGELLRTQNTNVAHSVSLIGDFICARADVAVQARPVHLPQLPLSRAPRMRSAASIVVPLIPASLLFVYFFVC